MTYGTEKWFFTAGRIRKLKVAQRAMEKAMFGVFLRDKLRNEDIRSRTRVTNMAHRISKLKWQWAGHIVRRTDSLVPVERPPTRWSDDLVRHAGSRWMQVALDRALWHSLGEAYVQ